MSHAKRPMVKSGTPVHITLKLRKGVANLRSREVFAGFKISARGAARFDFKIIHFSIQADHVHVVAEAASNKALAQGMRSFGGRLGKWVRRIVGGVGPVFAGRYHVNVLANPTKMKNALAYVLQNHAHHRKVLKHLDEFSSAVYFSQWRQLFGFTAGPLLVDHRRAADLPDYLSAPRSWLARDGWMRGDNKRLRA